MRKQVFTVMAATFFFTMLFAGSSPGGEPIMFEGIIKPVRQVELAFPIDGPVSAIYVKEGDHVRKGEKLLQLNDDLQKLEVERRKAMLTDHAALDSSRKRLDIISSLLDSTRALYQETASVSREEMQKMELEYQTIFGNVKKFEAEKVKQRIEYNIAAQMLARCALTSPIGGIVTQIDREEGEWARTGETVATVVDIATCEVEINVEQADARKLNTGDKATVRIGGENGMTVAGVATYIAPVADKASALVKVKVALPNASGKIIPGVPGKIEFE